MEISGNLAIVYLIVFRLAIIAAGTISIVLGYKLFVKGVFSGNSGGTGVEAEVGALKMSMKNAAPGSVFAFFGALVIGIMLVQEPPGLDHENGRTKLRGEDPGLAKPAQETNRQGATNGDLEAAVQSLIESADRYPNGINSLARHLARFSNGQAMWFYEQSQLNKALPLADIGVRLAPEDSDHLDTRAQILFAMQRYEEAIEVMQRAAALNPAYFATLEKFRRDQPR